ncbi:MAG: DUF99 family protein [Candidatus Aenigmatarchaeota archaeon]
MSFVIKDEIRVIAWDDCAFRFKQKNVLIVGAIFRGGKFLDGLLSTRIKKDGTDATEKIAASILKSRHYDQLSYIMLDGITFAGFNLVDIKKLHKKTKLPVIVIQRKKPDMKKFKEALKIFSDYKKRLNVVSNAGKISSSGKIYYQKAGLSNDECEELMKVTCVRSNVPEPIRVAHLIASGLSGESRGRA